MFVEPLISIIVPVYNTEAYLSQCIHSIIDQSYTNLEIVLVDDQSPDSCPQICESYAQKDSRIRVIHQQNTGVSGARNTGIRNANGAYLMFVDSDDELFPDAVKVLFTDLQKHDADIVSAIKLPSGKNRHIPDNGANGEYIVFRNEKPLLLSLAGQRDTNSVCSKLFKKEFIDGIYFTEGKNIHEDGFFLFQCYLRQPILVQQNVFVYQYNYRTQSNSHDAFSDKYLAMLYFCEEKKKLILEHYPQYTDDARNMEVRTNLQLLDLLCRTTESKYHALQKQCEKTVCSLYRFHRPINKHHQLLARIVRSRLYPVYKFAVRMKYYR